MQVQMLGARIEKSEFYAGKHYTIISLPAPDSFSFPSKYKLQSQAPLGQQGTFIDCTVNIQGIVKTKTIIDRNNGQQRVFDDATVLLECTHYTAAQVKQPIVKPQA